MSIWRITCKDLLLLAQDRTALVLLLILPLVFIAIVGMSTGQFLTRDDDADRFRIAVLDDSKSVTAENLIKELSSRADFQMIPVASSAEATEAVRKGEAIAFLEIGPRFEELVDDVRMGDLFSPRRGISSVGPSSLDITIHRKMTAGAFGRMLESVLFAQIVRFVIPIAAQKNPLARAWIHSHDDEDDESPESAAASQTSGNRKQNNSFLWVVPGFTVMFAFFLISIMAYSFITEREQGTLRRLLMAPVGSVSVLLGKIIPYYLTSVTQCFLLFICGRILFEMPWGNEPFYLIPVILCTSAAATTLGLLLSTCVRTEQQVSSYGTTMILVFSSISGCFFPREFFPKIMKQVSLITPHAWSLKAFDAVLTQQTVDPLLVASCCGMLLLFSVASFAIGLWRFQVTARA